MDEVGFERFAAEVSPALHRLARVLTGNEHDALDLVQDALVRVGLRWQRIEADRNPMGYTRTVLVRLNVDRFRRLRREVLLAATPEVPHHDDRGEAPDLAWLRPAWDSLTPHQRTVLGLRYLEDAGIDEIATLLGCRATTVRTHLSRGLDRIRVQLTDFGAEVPER